MERSRTDVSVCILVLFSVLLCVHAVRSPKVPLSKLYDLSPGTSPHFPQGQAERLIKSLGLLPGAAEDGPGPVNGPGLYERPIHLEVGGDSGAAVDLQDLGHHAGFYKLKRSHAANMFYFFFESRSNKSGDPVVLWMTGGPGCASELALFYENGPFKIVDTVGEDITLIWNDFGWDKEASIIFVDQPVGTGYSYSTDSRDIRHDEEGISEDMYDFFQAFFAAHPEYTKNDFFVMGESYAGHYVPAVTARLHEANRNKEGIPINLKGFAIGNGFTQPNIQYEAYADYALDMGLIDDSDHKRLSLLFPACASSIKLCGSKGTVTCVAAYLVCQSVFNSILSIAGNLNYYDVRKECNGDLCYDFSNLETYLNYPYIREALGVGDRKFLSCSPLVYEAMIMDWMKNLERGIPALLEDGIEMLVYAGEFDLICNWLGNSRWVTAMDWSGQEDYANAPWKTFEVEGLVAGLVTGYQNLNFVKVRDAGHMVPMDQPRNALEMVRRWTRGVPLGHRISQAKLEPKQIQSSSVFSS